MSAYNRAVTWLKAQKATNRRMLWPWELAAIGVIELNPLQDASEKTPQIVKKLVEWGVWSYTGTGVPTNNSTSAAGFPQFDFGAVATWAKSLFSSSAKTQVKPDLAGIAIMATVALGIVFVLGKRGRG